MPVLVLTWLMSIEAIPLVFVVVDEVDREYEPPVGIWETLQETPLPATMLPLLSVTCTLSPKTEEPAVRDRSVALLAAILDAASGTAVALKTTVSWLPSANTATAMTI
ncbi:MAG: hypothetical protein A3K13_03395 [Gemmatimonadetes bacterium RIFCSPLOWO2_12_FULL_68_9]|nr:MAG: hypothetical protein A3K13_03395 [Gemmatimonadetes bacterium RIFCSPLOWO2_12_FULL_68_9]